MAEVQQIADPRVVEPLADIQRSMRVVRRELTLRGPLPPPEMLAGYEEALPGLADRIVSMAENEQRHRHEVERTDLRQAYRVARAGQVFGLVALAIMTALAAYLAYLGHAGWAVAAAGIDVAAVVGVFVTGQFGSGGSPDENDGGKDAEPSNDADLVGDGQSRKPIDAGRESDAE
ncbi:DUF2335 domain-containing protein [Streptomyces sp. SUK 48]|uniref:DUF2335 domain-containing protein n=1 Tax=Streptomyces sp. SUK 48 TaxID=2582831 RepID=UPI00129B57D1|nr:DUF2335 domain-containing protein [Streptomyces sp. SUK 48]